MGKRWRGRGEEGEGRGALRVVVVVVTCVSLQVRELDAPWKLRHLRLAQVALKSFATRSLHGTASPTASAVWPTAGDAYATTAADAVKLTTRSEPNPCVWTQNFKTPGIQQRKKNVEMFQFQKGEENQKK